MAGTARELTLRTAVRDEIPGEIITVLPGKVWTHARCHQPRLAFRAAAATVRARTARSRAYLDQESDGEVRGAFSVFGLP